MTSLKQQLQKLQVNTKCNPGLSSNPEAGEVPLMELTISCDNLRCDGHGWPPSPQAALEYLDPSVMMWQPAGQTESIEDSSNPIFLVTLPLWNCMGIQKDTKLDETPYYVCKFSFEKKMYVLSW